MGALHSPFSRGAVRLMGGCVCGGIVGWEAPVGPSGPFVAAKVTPSPRTSMHGPRCTLNNPSKQATCRHSRFPNRRNLCSL
jgi:hypothetical protein